MIEEATAVSLLRGTAAANRAAFGLVTPDHEVATREAAVAFHESLIRATLGPPEPSSRAGRFFEWAWTKRTPEGHRQHRTEHALGSKRNLYFTRRVLAALGQPLPGNALRDLIIAEAERSVAQSAEIAKFWEEEVGAPFRHRMQLERTNGWISYWADEVINQFRGRIAESPILFAYVTQVETVTQADIQNHQGQRQIALLETLTGQMKTAVVWLGAIATATVIGLEVPPGLLKEGIQELWSIIS